MKEEQTKPSSSSWSSAATGMWKLDPGSSPTANTHTHTHVWRQRRVRSKQNQTQLPVQSWFHDVQTSLPGSYSSQPKFCLTAMMKSTLRHHLVMSHRHQTLELNIVLRTDINGQVQIDVYKVKTGLMFSPLIVEF